MRKGLLIGAIIIVFGWIVYDFVDPFAETEDKDDRQTAIQGKVNEDGGTTSPADQDVGDADEVGLEVGNTAPDFELETWEGETVKLSDYRGEKVIVNFWATWCPPCRAEIPDFRKFHDEKDVEILAVNVTETEKSSDGIGSFIDEYEMDFPVLMDEASEVVNEYKVMAYPTSYIIDEEGIIQFVAPGAMNYDIMVREYDKMDE